MKYNENALIVITIVLNDLDFSLSDILRHMQGLRCKYAVIG